MHQHRYHAYCLRVFRHAGEDVASVAVGGAPTHAGRLLKQSILFANGSNYFQICSVSSPVFWIRNRDSNCIRIQQLTDPDPYCEYVVGSTQLKQPKVHCQNRLLLFLENEIRFFSKISVLKSFQNIFFK